METFAKSTVPEKEKESAPPPHELEVLFANNDNPQGAGLPSRGSDSSIKRE